MSVPSANDHQATFAATLVDEWIRGGVTNAVVCPGSRSTPLALALSERQELTLHVRLDERSAGFFALGVALRTNQPVVVLVTSGTAAAELHAAVVEADYSHVPLIVVTADRPPELHGVGAPQTIEQRHLFGSSVRRYEEPPVADADNASQWRGVARRLLVASTKSSVRGPVHLNVAFREPLLGSAAALPPPLDTDGAAPAAKRPRIWWPGSKKTLAVVGPGTPAGLVETMERLDWVVLSDATTSGGTPYADPLLRSDAFATAARPDVVVRVGAVPASKVVLARLAEWNVPVVGLHLNGVPGDPSGIITLHEWSAPDLTSSDDRADAEYARWWRDAVKVIDDHLSDLDQPTRALDEPTIARALATLCGEHDVALVVGSSMPVRDVEWWAPQRTSPVFANRGANGIDGVVSTIFGVANSSRAVGYVGDLTMLHDVSALVEGVGASGSCTLVVADNNGGGIFSFLPQGAELASTTFEELFGTPRHHDLVAIARAFGHRATRVGTVRELRAEVGTALRESGVSVIICDVPTREDNVTRHQELNEGVAAVIAEHLA